MGVARAPCTILTLLLCICSACTTRTVDLSAVQQYAKTTAEAGVSFDAIADDYYQSCLRRREYAQPGTVGGKTLSSMLPTRPSPPSAPQPGATPHELNPATEDPDCNDASSIAYQWQLENAVVVGYVRSLGDVAGVDTAPKNFGDLASALKSAGAINSDATATAAGDLATALANALIAARQQAALHDIVQAAHDKGLSTVVKGLQYTARAYQGKVERERTAVRSYYSTILVSEQQEYAVLQCSATQDSGLRRLLACSQYRRAPSLKSTVEKRARAAELRDLIRRQRIDRITALNAIDGRIQAAQDYSDAVGAIGSGNDALLAVPPHDMHAIVATVRPYVDLLGDKVAAMVAALRK